jgi:Dirigent-like protein
MKMIDHPGAKLRIATVSTTLVLAALAAVATSSDASTRRSDVHPRASQFGVHFSRLNVIDVPPLQATPGDYRAGDYLVFSDTLTDKHGHRIGEEAGTGVITRVGSSSGAQILYSMAIHLPGGQITASGLGSTDPHKLLAITGGTGSFGRAHGSIRVLENGDAADTGSLQILLR